jgi:hypothetical protein
MRVVESLMDELARVVPALRHGRGFADVFTDEDAGSWQIEPRDDAGTCPFLFGRNGRALCAIHHTALATGRDVADVKPRACRHWPLVLESRGRRLWVTVHPSARHMGCVAPVADLPGQPTIRAAFASEIDELRRLVGREAGRAAPAPARRGRARSLTGVRPVAPRLH